MKKFYYYILMLAGTGFLAACDNGNADIVLIDSPPLVELVDVPSSAEPGSTISFTAVLQDGASDELSSSPLAGYSWTLTDTTSQVVVDEGTGSASGLAATVPVSIETMNLDTLVYELNFSAFDTQNLSSVPTSNYIKIANCPEPAATIGIIGSATPGGWDADTDMTMSSENPYVWTISIELVDGEAKFRQDDGWTINWGDSAFPSGTGTQNGPNIPVTAGTYNVTFNSCSGSYSFE